MYVAIVLPAYNEEANIVQVVTDVHDHMMKMRSEMVISDFIIIVVDDGSSDNTYKRCKNLEYSELEIIQHGRNLRYGAAIRTGFKTALNINEVTHVFMMDADGQFAIESINKFISIAKENSSAFIVGYREKRADGLIRKINGTGWTIVNSVLIRHRIRDVDCASKLISRELLDGVTLKGDAATINSELFMIAKKNDYEIIQIPVSHFPRVAGHQTGANLSVIVKSFLSLYRTWRDIRNLQTS